MDRWLASIVISAIAIASINVVIVVQALECYECDEFGLGPGEDCNEGNCTGFACITEYTIAYHKELGWYHGIYKRCLEKVDEEEAGSNQTAEHPKATGEFHLKKTCVGNLNEPLRADLDVLGGTMVKRRCYCLGKDYCNKRAGRTYPKLTMFGVVAVSVGLLKLFS